MPGILTIKRRKARMYMLISEKCISDKSNILLQRWTIYNDHRFNSLEFIAIQNLYPPNKITSLQISTNNKNSDIYCWWGYKFVQFTLVSNMTLYLKFDSLI